MIPETEYVNIAKGLLEKTRNRTAEWQQQSKSEFLLRLPKSMIVLEYVSPPAEEDKIVLRILSHDGPRVGLWEVYESDPNWELASQLYQEVSGFVVGVDHILDEIHSYLKS